MIKQFLTRPTISTHFKQRLAYSTAADSGKKMFLILAKDFTDPGCLERRMAIREKHLVVANDQKDRSLMFCGGALLDSHESGKMEGSAIVAWSDSIEELKERVESDPYYTGKVWEKYTIYPYKLAINIHDKA
ncbi:hypothetical protein CLU79DRAFT_719528 [Phycomyces nitens]|nr:hypothetical protein CLU79DRAFT_719528 [Phycomyces nitens]